MGKPFKFNKKMQYDTVYEAGQVIDHLPAADTENLRLGGFGDYVEPEPIPAQSSPGTPAERDRMIRQDAPQTKNRKAK